MRLEICSPYSLSTLKITEIQNFEKSRLDYYINLNRIKSIIVKLIILYLDKKLYLIFIESVVGKSDLYTNENWP